MWGLKGLIWLIGIANAETPEEMEEKVINYEEELQKSQEQNTQLTEELDELKNIRDQFEALDETLMISEETITQLSILIDTRQEEEERVEAARVLNEIKEDQTLPFYWSILGETQAISWAILDGLTGFSDPAEVKNIVQKGLYIQNTFSQSRATLKLGRTTNLGLYSEKAAELDADLVLKTINVAGQLQQDDIALLLVDFTKDMSVPYELRLAAFSTLESSYADFLDRNGRYALEKESHMLANQIYALSIGATTSALLGSVGIWGQSEVSEGIGYGGGLAMGVTGGYLYADQLYRPTLGQATLMGSSVAWGLVDGLVLAESLDLNEEQTALAQTVGVLTGAGYGYWRRDDEIDAKNVLELDFMGYWGAQMAVGVRDIAGDSFASVQEPYYEDYYDYEDPNADYEAADVAYYAAYDEFELQVDAIRNKRQQSMLIGSALGLGVGHKLTETWDVKPESILFSGVYSAEFASASTLAIEAFDVSYEDSIGYVRTGIHGAMGGALLYDHFHPVTYEQSLFSAYGSGIGHLLGSGIPYLARRSDQGVAHGMLWTGLVGTGVGTYIGNDMNFTYSDWVMNGVGAGLSVWHFAALSEVVNGYELTKDDQDLGVLNTGVGISGLGLIYAGTKGEILIEDSLFLGTTTAWGAYYGALLPLALNLELESHEHLLMTLIASDIGLIGGSYGVFKTDYEPKRSVLPQFLGVTGATLGALGSFLFTTDSQTVTANTLGWGTLGIAGGVIWERTKRNNGKTTELGFLPDLNGKLARNVQFQMTPQVDPEGNVGVYVGMYNRGF